MSVRPKMHTAEKFSWVGVLVALAILEVLAIGRSDRENAAKRDEEDRQFKNIADTQHLEFEATSNQLLRGQTLEELQFESTMLNFSETSYRNQANFESLIDKDKELYKHQDELAGPVIGKLAPGTEPTPPNICPTPDDGEVLVFIGDISAQNVIVVNKFPSVVLAVAVEFAGVAGLEIESRRPSSPLVTLDRSSNGDISVNLTIRAKDGKLIARMDEEGFFVNRNQELQVLKSRNSLKVIDDYGAEVLNVRYLNDRTVAVSGLHISFPPTMSKFCTPGPAVLIPGPKPN